MHNRNKDIYELYKSNGSLRDIAVKYGLSHEGVRRIVNKAKSTPQITETVNTEVINKTGLKLELDSMIASASLVTDKDIRLENLKTILNKVEYYKAQGFKLTGYSLRRIQAKIKSGKVERKTREENKPYRNRVLQSTEVRQNILMLACHFFFKAAGSGRKGRHGKRLSGNIKLTCDLIIKFAKEHEEFYEIAAIPTTTLYRTLKTEFKALSAREHHQYINHYNLWKKNRVKVPGAFTDNVEFGDWIVGDDHRSDINKVLVWNKTRRVYEKKAVMGWDWKELKTQKVLGTIETPGELKTEHLITSLMQALAEFGRPAKGILVDNGLGTSQKFVEFCNRLKLGIKYAKPHEPTGKSPEERSFGYIKNEHDVFQTNFTGSLHQEEGRHPTSALSAPAPDMTFDQYNKSLHEYFYGFYETRERLKVISGKRIKISIRDLYNNYIKNWDKVPVTGRELRYAYSARLLKKFEYNKLSFIRDSIVYEYSPKEALPPAFNNRKYYVELNPLQLNKIDIYASEKIYCKITGWQVLKGEYVTTMYNLRGFEEIEKQERVQKLNQQIGKYHKKIAQVVTEKTALAGDIEIASVLGNNGISDELRKKERKVKRLIEQAMPVEKIELAVTASDEVREVGEITEADWAEVDNLLK